MVYRLHSVTLNTDAMGAPVYIPDCLDLDTPFNPQHLAELVGHVTSPTHAAIVSLQPVITFNTFAVEATLDEIGTTGLVIASAVNSGVLLNLGLIDDTGEFASGSVHRTVQIRRGVIVPMRLTVDNRGNARLQCGIYPLQLTGAAVLTLNETAALPTIAVASSRWTLGSVEIDGSDLSDYNNFDVDFGNTVRTDGTQSDVYDTHIMEKSHAPTFMIRGVDPQWFTATTPLPIGGVAAAHADTVVYLRKRTQDGAHFVVDGTAEHIKLTMSGVASMDEGFRGQASRVGESSLRITGAIDASGNNPIVITTGSAIT